MSVNMNANERPWMVAVESQFGALSIVRKLARMADVPRSVTDEHALRMLPKSVPFSWSADTTKAVWLASKSIPMDAEFDFDLLPDQISAAWWWLEWPLPLQLKHPNADDWDGLDCQNICCLLLTRDSDGWTISAGRMSRDFQFPFLIEIQVVPLRASIAGITDGYCFDQLRDQLRPTPTRDVQLLRFVLAACAWLKQKVVTIQSGHIERHHRKRIIRESAAVVNDVKIVELRRLESSPHYHQAVAGHDPIEWRCRWIVGGHWRNQPYKDQRKLIYIMPYVKGPEDMPLKVPTHTVYQVSR